MRSLLVFLAAIAVTLAVPLEFQPETIAEIQPIETTELKRVDSSLIANEEQIPVAIVHEGSPIDESETRELVRPKRFLLLKKALLAKAVLGAGALAVGGLALKSAGGLGGGLGGGGGGYGGNSGGYGGNYGGNYGGGGYGSNNGGSNYGGGYGSSSNYIGSHPGTTGYHKSVYVVWD